ncbi:Mur ligase family protein [Bryobacter aggregatus]|uniref:Mur ligase family protein n=1 Tax=Bryobacter aggregatus TaxID=360054 RepID=UPI0004E0BD14|nr:UDP-N-acetylmuramoyl-tripeptide--D-alanyl-D-alanine ligase [Bryobacter aggregatus]
MFDFLPKPLQHLPRYLLITAAAIWRRLMFRTTFIAISGSVGKTTAKEAIADVLATRYRTVRTAGSDNHFSGLSFSLFRVRPWHHYAVLEIGLDRPGQMKMLARVAKPDIAVWTNVARTHMMHFKTLETIAEEKADLIRSLRPGGVAILNRDNPYIASYPVPDGLKTIYYGTGEEAEFRGHQAESHWPDRLRFRLSHGSEEHLIQTRFLGTHWLPSLLPAFAIAKLTGIAIDEAAAAISSMEPSPARLSVASAPNGAIFLRDERNGSVDTLQVALDVLEAAQAERKIIVFSDVSDSKGKPKKRIADLGKIAARIAHAAVFIGDHSQAGVEAAIAAGMPVEQAWSFYTVEDAAIHLQHEARAGDFILLRGRNSDHLSRIYLATRGEVKCWRESCHKSILCDECPELRNPKPVS